MSAGITHHVSDAVSLSLGVAASRNLFVDAWDPSDGRANVVVGIGSLQRRGL